VNHENNNSHRGFVTNGTKNYATRNPSKRKGLPSAQVAKVPELVTCQDGAVVSRAIVKKPIGDVTLFAFDVGQGLSEHTAPFDALAQVLEGDVEITISGHDHLLQHGEILMPAWQTQCDTRSLSRTADDDRYT